MDTKHTPATPLSWVTNTAIHPNDQIFDVAGKIVADCKWTPFTPGEREQNAAYLTHTATHYGALVEALHGICDAKRPLEWSPTTELAEAFSKARAILCSLGEDA